MYNIQLDWSNLKTNFISKNFIFNYKEVEHGYEVYVQDRSILWSSYLCTEENILDFENNYKINANKKVYSDDGKEIVRSESRPLNCTTYFTCRSDSESNVGDGKLLEWDFSNEDDIVQIPSGETGKRKRIEFSFIDTIYIKEGAIYFYNAPKGCYLDLYVVCPSGYPYYKNDGSIAFASQDTIISHYVNHHYLQDSVPMGDELNTEVCSSGVPSYYKFWIDITSTENDEISNGNVSLEIYRERSIIL